jgi:hypothetical protein
MLYNFLNTFRVFPHSLLWVGFQYEPNINVKKAMFLFIAGMTALLHSLGWSLLTSFILVCLCLEVVIRLFIIQ